MMPILTPPPPITSSPCLSPSILLYLLFLLSYSQLVKFTGQFYYVPYKMFSRGIFWLLMLLVPTISVIIDYLGLFWKITFSPDPVELAIEMDR